MRSASKAWLRALEVTAPIAGHPTRTFPVVVEELAERFGDAPALVSEAEILSFRLLNERSNRYARWAMTYGVRKGDTVCLLMPNRPEYMAIWIGICRAGGTRRALNTHLVGPSLARSIDTVAPRHVIVARELLDHFRTATPHIATTAVVWSHGDGDPAFPDIAQAVAELEGAPLTGRSVRGDPR